MQPDQLLLILLNERGPVIVRHGCELCESALQGTQKFKRLSGRLRIPVDFRDQGLGRRERLLELAESGVMFRIALEKVLEASL
ncbi:hypothetical protein, partial [Bradyrhizobium algeriense]|uniref:hypothetical protein n=1 Tax=Bradyrhizobium algeriense TaxID=634784 RepID=UPI001AECE91F